MTESRVRRWRRSLRVLLVAVAGPTLAVGALTASPAHAAAADDIRINVVVTTGDVNDSVELYNKGTATVDLSGWILRDDNDSSTYAIAAGTTLAPGGFVAFDVHNAFGLGSDDEARLYLADGTTLVDSFGWTQHSDPSWSRCPDGTGAFSSAAVTLGAANDCGSGGLSATAWPLSLIHNRRCPPY
ncbi:lamin tail domain-containing protein, partial [Streptomyces sp. NPDC059627]